MNATASDVKIATDEPTGIGRMYGTHHPRDERHRQNCRDDGERRENRGIAHLVHCFDRGDLRRAVTETQVPVDVLDDDDRIVDEMPIEKISAKSVMRLSV
jgi:hypothetical protein